MRKARQFQKNIYFCFIDYAKAFDCVDHNKLWKILKEMGILDDLTWLLRNLYSGQEATVRAQHSTPGLPVDHQLPESTQTHVHCVSDATQPFHLLLPPFPPALNLPQHLGLFQ